jgi:hypothetical protein
MNWQSILKRMKQVRRDDRPEVRLVDHMVIYDAPLDFSALCERLVDENTRYLVFDLDRTIHLGHNVGELLGWELCAHDVYGEEYFNSLAIKERKGRFVIDKKRPLASLHYVLRGAAVWAYPGLFYLFFGKIGLRFAWSRALMGTLFGSAAVEKIQAIPRLAMMNHLATLPLTTSRRLAKALWKRLEPDQVVLREDIAALRERFPNLRIIISSASPLPALEAAQEALGVDDIICTTVEEYEGKLSAPYLLGRLNLLMRLPERISRPSSQVENASYHKIDNLLKRYPDFLDEGVESIGITDTSHGEDYAWAQFFTKVVDVNSPDPFSPIVAAGSPLREIHSAKLLTRKERMGTQAHAPAPMRAFTSAQLNAMLDPFSRVVQELSERHAKLAELSAMARSDLEAGMQVLITEIEAVVERFNAATGRERNRALDALHGLLRRQRGLERRLIRLERPLTRISHTIAMQLERSRHLLNHTAATLSRTS